MQIILHSSSILHAHSLQFTAVYPSSKLSILLYCFLLFHSCSLCITSPPFSHHQITFLTASPPSLSHARSFFIPVLPFIIPHSISALVSSSIAHLPAPDIHVPLVIVSGNTWSYWSSWIPWQSRTARYYRASGSGWTGGRPWAQRKCRESWTQGQRWYARLHCMCVCAYTCHLWAYFI